jgi:tetratricopeptide (TPR) repeat protein
MRCFAAAAAAASLCAAAASAGAADGAGPSDAATPSVGDLVYQLHDLAERCQLSPERDYELAASLYAQAIALEPLNAALRYNAGIVQKNLGQHRAAIELYESALLLDPTLRQAHFNLARSLQMLSDHVSAYPDSHIRTAELERALVHFQASVTAADPGGLKNSEEVLYQLGRVEEAKEAYAQYVQLQPKGAVHAHDALSCDGTGDASVRHYLANVVKLSGGELVRLSEAMVESLCALSFFEPKAGGESTEEGLDGLDEALLQPAYQHVAQGYRRQRRSDSFACPAALTGSHATTLSEYYDVPTPGSHRHATDLLNIPGVWDPSQPDVLPGPGMAQARLDLP